MELDTSYIVLTMAQAHDLSFFRIDRRNFQTIREVFLGDRPREDNYRELAETLITS